MEFFVRCLIQELKARKINVRVVIGGSVAQNEISVGSDTDVYLIAKNFFELYKLLRMKDVFQQIKNEFGKYSDIILLNQQMIDWKLYYLYGKCVGGRWITPAYDRILQRNNNLKLAYRSLGLVFFKPETKNHFLPKALLYGLYSIALSKNILSITQPLTYSARTLFENAKYLESIISMSDLEHILQARLTGQPVELTVHDETIVEYVLQQAYEYFLKNPFSVRSYLLYNIFGIKQGTLKYTFKNPDKYIIDRFRKAILAKDYSIFSIVETETFKILVV